MKNNYNPSTAVTAVPLPLTREAEIPLPRGGSGSRMFFKQEKYRQPQGLRLRIAVNKKCTKSNGRTKFVLPPLYF